MKTTVQLFGLFLILFLTNTSISAQTSLAGKVTEEESGEPVLFGNVALYKGGVLITGVETDFDGNYSISNIDPGTYDVEASYVGFNTQRITRIPVKADRVNRLDIQLSTGGVNLEEVIVKKYSVPLIKDYCTTQGGIVTADQIKTLPTQDINGLAAMSIQQTFAINGTITDKKSGQAISNANITLTKGKNIFGGGRSGYKGKFYILSIKKKGRYTMIVKHKDYHPKRIRIRIKDKHKPNLWNVLLRKKK